MADFYVISRSDDSSCAEVRLVEGDISAVYNHGSKAWFESNAWWTLINDVLPDADSADQVSVTLLSEEIKFLITEASQFVEEDENDAGEVLAAKSDREHLLKMAARLIELARTETVWFLKDEQDTADRNTTEEEFHEIADQVYGRGR